MLFSTLAVHGPARTQTDLAHGAIPPLHLATTFTQPSSVEEGPFAYARGGNPTRAELEALIAALEGGPKAHGFAFASGMAATAAVFSLFKTGQRVLISDGVYGGTYRFASKLFAGRGLEYDLVHDFTEVDWATLPSNVTGVFIETPANPLLTVTDIAATAQQAHQRGLLVIVDNTFLTPYFQKPLELGADIVVHSATKYLGGHSDLLTGLAVTRNPDLAERLALLQNTLGAVPSPRDAYELIRSIKTLPLRMDRHESNTKAILEFLQSHPAVTKLYYPALSPESRAIQARQAKGDGAVVSFELKPEWDSETFLTSLEIIQLAVSLGSVESLICRPATQTHEAYPPEVRQAIGLSDDLLRLSIGIEDVKDLIRDLTQALDKAATTIPSANH